MANIELLRNYNINEILLKLQKASLVCGISHAVYWTKPKQKRKKILKQIHQANIIFDSNMKALIKISKNNFKCELLSNIAEMYPRHAPCRHKAWMKFFKLYSYYSYPHYAADYVMELFKKLKNKYGLLIYYHISGFRIGDKIDKDKKNVNKMINFQIKAYELAKEIKSWKHLYSTFYWIANYCEKIDKKMSCQYYNRAFEELVSIPVGGINGYNSRARKILSQWYRLEKKEKIDEIVEVLSQKFPKAHRFFPKHKRKQGRKVLNIF